MDGGRTRSHVKWNEILHVHYVNGRRRRFCYWKLESCRILLGSYHRTRLFSWLLLFLHSLLQPSTWYVCGASMYFIRPTTTTLLCSTFPESLPPTLLLSCWWWWIPLRIYCYLPNELRTPPTNHPISVFCIFKMYRTQGKSAMPFHWCRRGMGGVGVRNTPWGSISPAMWWLGTSLNWMRPFEETVEFHRQLNVPRILFHSWYSLLDCWLHHIHPVDSPFFMHASNHPPTHHNLQCIAWIL